MSSVYINGLKVSIKEGSSVLQACESSGVYIPRYCFHERLLVAGNCRICLVEIEKAPKPVASCAMPVSEGIKVYTDTPQVKKAREAIIEFLLINHPLDCPICDQGGECDLQNQSSNYGSDMSRFFFKKRSVADKNIGPLVQIIITRCIHCTRCVRFINEVCGDNFFGIVGRGSGSEIGTYVSRVVTSNLSGNVVDLCPVGYFSNKKYKCLF